MTVDLLVLGADMAALLATCERVMREAERGEVLLGARTERLLVEPIPGLLPAGSDSGGVYVRAYAGGIANALVYGLTAADTALPVGVRT